MKRLLFPFTLITILLVLAGKTALAQVAALDRPGQDAEPTATSFILPTIVVPTVVPLLQRTQEPPPATSVILPTLAESAVTTPTPDSAPTPEALPTDSSVLKILINARTDLEILANQQLGSTRPPGWSGSLDINNPQLPVLIRLDLEILRGTLLGADTLPPGWFGAVPSTPFAIARDIRHDLELLADTVIQPSVRPPGWAGDDPLMRCNRSTQGMVRVLERNGLFVSDADPSQPNYCQQVETQIGQYVEVNLVNSSLNLQSGASGSNNASNPIGSASGGTANALDAVGLAFLDRYATQRVGAIPTSVRLTPVARSFTLFSHMTLVRGDNFEVFVDYKTTTISAQTFSTLPNVNDVGIKTFCSASWCQSVTFIPGIGSNGRRGGYASTGLVNAGSNMVIYYDGEDQDGMTKVRMELCDRPTKTNQALCEPATEVILPDGSAAPIVGTEGGLSQFYVPYSYTTTQVFSRNFFTADLWIDPPEQRR